MNNKEQSGDTLSTPVFDKFNDRLKGVFSSEKNQNSESLMKEVKTSDSNNKSNTNKNKIKGLVSPIEKPVHLRSKKPLKRISITEMSNEELQHQHSPNSTEKKAINESKSRGLSKKIEDEINSKLTQEDTSQSLTIPSVPANSAKFLSDWKSLKTIVNRAKFLQQFKANDYLKVFKNSLDGTVFSELVLVLHHLVQRGVMPEIVVEQLRGLSGLPRVSAVAMFMSKQDREKLRYLTVLRQFLFTWFLSGIYLRSWRL